MTRTEKEERMARIQERLLELASKRYNDLDKVNEPMCKAAYYCYSMTSTTIDEGEFWLPGVQELYIILKDIKYGTVSDINADIVNKALNKVGWASISNSAYYWSACHSNYRLGWCGYGNYGIFGAYFFFGSHACLAVSLYPLTLKS